MSILKRHGFDKIKRIYLLDELMGRACFFMAHDKITKESRAMTKKLRNKNFVSIKEEMVGPAGLEPATKGL